ncbi:hypothetical protein DIURU_002823 [Diutina rugosa]|uniref:Uncharacterized protein n=1 Tax=Diutina rugosa TaxID=5481 RepID=A0A642UNJ9_DIURU|nr:uncharacterized protein DIURU_002823 [Diutina rugosa]KAA8902369.1 hypothetical protein DIURU_002823 [Diutina rugosa]
MDQEEVYVNFLNYDWNNFPEYQEGLNEILSNYQENLREQDPTATISALDLQQLTDQAKVFFFCSKNDQIIELEEYRAWERQWGDRYRKSKKIEEIQPEESRASTQDEQPYSSNYQNVVELILAGKEVPGIKQIPDTVLSDQKSTAQVQQRKKPWES